MCVPESLSSVSERASEAYGPFRGAFHDENVVEPTSETSVHTNAESIVRYLENGGRPLALGSC